MGDGLAGTLSLVVELLGATPMPPRWALGYLQSTRHFESREELLRVARAFGEKRLPCDALILLSSYGEMLGWNEGVGHLNVQPRLFRSAAELVAGIKQAGLRVVTHEYPVVHTDSALHTEAEERGFLLDAAYPNLPEAERIPTSYHEGQRYFDFNNPIAASWWWDRHQTLCAAGVDGWWLDGGDGPPSRESNDGRHNRYDLARQAGFAAGEARDRPERRPFLFCRSGGPGMQRWGAACWSGDVNASFASLEAQLALGLSMGLSGVPLWGSDTGGYYPTEPPDPELFVRWFQLSAFTPIFRAHGRHWREHLPWSHGPEVEAICRRYLELRYRLLPYTYTLCHEAHRQGLPLMRPLVLAYPDDPAVKDLANPYLWGPNLLVAPVTRAGATCWPVYLPRGVWHDFWTGAAFEGGRAVEVEAPLDRLPLFVRAGAILPLADVAASHRPARALELLIYPQGSSQLTLYDDDGESMAYSAGAFVETTITCVAEPSDVVVHIHPPAGELPVLPPDRTYSLRVRAEAPPTSVMLANGSPLPWRMEQTDRLILDSVTGPAEVRIRW
jgi:alpha-glucosidase (family GH31 glycosyl hydrolase)